MPSLNKVMLIGRLTRDPELRYTSSGLAVCSFSIAVDRRFKNPSGEKQTDFFRCSAWRQTAEFVNTYVTKGKLVAVDGRIEMNKFVGQDGVEKQSADIVCDQVELLESNREQGDGGGTGGGGYNAGGSTPSAPRPAASGGGQADTGNGYYPDDEMAAAPAPQNRAPRPAAQANPNAGGARPAAAPNRPAGGAPAARPAPRPEPAYPENDFDDSDPFSDE